MGRRKRAGWLIAVATVVTIAPAASAATIGPVVAGPRPQGRSGHTDTAGPATTTCIKVDLQAVATALTA
jgi:hypothetical protein